MSDTVVPAANPPKLIWFKKELISNGFIINGRVVPFIAYEGNRGLLSLEVTPENQPLITALRKAFAEQTGGIVEITAEEAEEFKKKVNLQTKFVDRSLRRSELRLHSAPPRSKQADTEPAAQPVDNPTTPIRPTAIERITVPPPEAGFIIPDKPAEGPTAPARHKPETRRVVTPEKVEA